MRKPSCSRRARILPVWPAATASGLIIENVLSVIVVGLFLQPPRDRLAHLRRRLHYGYSRCFHRLHLVGGRAFAARDDGAGMTHAPSGWRGLSGNETDYRLLHVL